MEKWRNKDEFTKKKFERDPYGAAMKKRRETAQNETEMTGLPEGSRQHFLIFLVVFQRLEGNIICRLVRNDVNKADSGLTNG